MLVLILVADIQLTASTFSYYISPMSVFNYHTYFVTKSFWSVVTLKISQGHWNWYEQVKLNFCHTKLERFCLKATGEKKNKKKQTPMIICVAVTLASQIKTDHYIHLKNFSQRSKIYLTLHAFLVADSDGEEKWLKLLVTFLRKVT